MEERYPNSLLVGWVDNQNKINPLATLDGETIPIWYQWNQLVETTIAQFLWSGRFDARVWELNEPESMPRDLYQDELTEIEIGETG